MTYSEKLRDPRWQKRRLEIYERDKFTCQECGATTKSLHCHHLDYEKSTEPWEYPAKYLLTLCEDCHAKVDSYRKPIESSIIKSLRLSLKDYFSYKCAEEVFSSPFDLQRIIFLLWHLGIDKALPILEKHHSKNSSFPQNLIHCLTADDTCVVCGGNMIFYKKYKHYKCDACGFDLPVSDKKFEELIR
jgi:hypothetical protein